MSRFAAAPFRAPAPTWCSTWPPQSAANARPTSTSACTATWTPRADCSTPAAPLGSQPTFVFASSLAVFGNLPGQPLPDLIEDFTLPTPQSSYGIQKFIGEQLVADYARKGFIRGRSVRLMTVSVRPGKPNGAASSFLSGMIREPLAGQKAACPVPPETLVALASPARTIEGIIRAAQASDDAMGPAHRRQPSVPAHQRRRDGQSARAGGRQGCHGPAGLGAGPGHPAPRPDLARQCGVCAGTGAGPAGGRGLRLRVVREYIRENPDAVKLPVR